jgi:hypothetical protein
MLVRIYYPTVSENICIEQPQMQSVLCEERGYWKL